MTMTTVTKAQTSPLPSSNTTSTTSTTTTTLPAIQDKVNWSVLFPIKLHRMLDEIEKKGKSDIISWLPPDGKFFKVHDAQRFEQEIMPIYFGSTKYRSFQKNLNMWGFTIIRGGYYRGSCFHPLFMKESAQTCYRMQRQHCDRSSKCNKKNKKTRTKEDKMLSSSTGNGSSSLSSSRSPPKQEKNQKVTAKRHHKEDTSMDCKNICSSKNTTDSKVCDIAAAHIHETRLNQDKEEMSLVHFSVPPEEDASLNVDPSMIASSTSTMKNCNIQEEKHRRSSSKAKYWTKTKNGQKIQEQQHRYTNIAFHEGNKVVPDLSFPLLQSNAPPSPSSRNVVQLPLQKRRKTEARDTLLDGTAEGRNSNIDNYHFQMKEYEQQQRKLLLVQMALQANYDSMLSLAVIKNNTYINGDRCSSLVGRSSPSTAVFSKYVPSNSTLLSPSIHPLPFQQTFSINKNNILQRIGDENIFQRMRNTPPISSTPESISVPRYALPASLIIEADNKAYMQRIFCQNLQQQR